MATYAIGDVQGCLKALKALLAALDFNPNADRIVLLGDLVNRGPDSLGVLRYVRGLGMCATTVLGNHDLHLLALAHGGSPGRRDTLNAVLAAPDCDELLDWLIRQPLAWCHPESGSMLVHAGLAPQWSVELTLELAQQASSVLSGKTGPNFLSRMYGDEPSIWKDSLRGVDRTRFVVNCLTRARYCDEEGRLDLRHKGTPGSQPPHLRPWFQIEQRVSRQTPIVFGHWSTLGRVYWEQEQVFGLDTGCVWGGKLTALELETRMITQVDSGLPQPAIAGGD